MKSGCAIKVSLLALISALPACGGDDDTGNDSADAARLATDASASTFDATAAAPDATPAVTDAAPALTDAAPALTDAAAMADASVPDAATATFRSPTAYWSMDTVDISGAALADLIGSVDGVIAGASADVGGQIGQALAFDGTDDYVDFGDSLDAVFAGSDRAFSVAMWLKPSAPTDGRIVFGKTSDTACIPDEDGRQWIIVLSERIPRFTYQPLRAGSAHLVSAATTLDGTGTWVHVVAVYDGSIDTAPEDRVTLYIDAAAESTTYVGTGGFPFDLADSPARLAAGVRLDSTGTPCVESGSASYAGSLDELAIWDVALTADEVTAIHARGAAGNRLTP